MKMNIRDIFVPSFVALVASTLDSSCPGPEVMTRLAVAQTTLTVDDPTELPMERLSGVISLMLAAGLLPAWEGRRGRDGGIGRKGVERVKVKGETKLDAAFHGVLIATLASAVPASGSVKRGDIAKKLGNGYEAGGETELKISGAFQASKFLGARVLLDGSTGYKTKRGIGGGICRMTDAEVVMAQTEFAAKVPAVVTAEEAFEAVTSEADADAFPQGISDSTLPAEMQCDDQTSEPSGTLSNEPVDSAASPPDAPADAPAPVKAKKKSSKAPAAKAAASKPKARKSAKTDTQVSV